MLSRVEPLISNSQLVCCKFDSVQQSSEYNFNLSDICWVTKLITELRTVLYAIRLGLTSLYMCIETFKLIWGFDNIEHSLFLFLPSTEFGGRSCKLNKILLNFVSNYIDNTWNNLPDITINAVSINSFKNIIDNWFDLTSQSFQNLWDIGRFHLELRCTTSY